jgi:hypothetical protein
MKLRTLALALLGLGSPLAAQAAAGDVIAAGFPKATVGGGLFLIDAVKGTMTPITGVTGDLKYAYSVDQDPWLTTNLIVGTTGSDQTPAVDPNIYSVVAGSGKVLATKKLNSVLLTGDKRILDLDVVGNEIWFLTDTRLARMPLAGGAPVTVVKHTRRNPVMSTDGRFIYTDFDGGGFGRGEVYQIDPNNTKHWARIFGTPPINLDYIRSIELGADGQLLVMAKGNFSGPDLYSVNIRTGLSTSKIVMFPPHFQAWKCVEDAKTRDLIALGSGSEDQASTWRGGKMLHAKAYGASTGNLRGLTVRRSPWLHRSGILCLPSIQNHQFFGNSVPEIGNSKYALTLLKKGAAGGLLLIGANGALPKPVSLSGLGMTGCDLGVLPIVAIAITVPASGSLTLPLPIPTTLGRSNIDVQLVLTEAGANKAGLITGQVGTIMVR